MATCGAKPLTTGDVGNRLAAIHKVLRSISLQTPMNSHSELELVTLRNIQPMKLGLKQMCQAAVELARWTLSVINWPRTFRLSSFVGQANAVGPTSIEHSFL